MRVMSTCPTTVNRSSSAVSTPAFCTFSPRAACRIALLSCGSMSHSPLRNHRGVDGLGVAVGAAAENGAAADPDRNLYRLNRREFPEVVAGRAVHPGGGDG